LSSLTIDHPNNPLSSVWLAGDLAYAFSGGDWTGSMFVLRWRHEQEDAEAAASPAAPPPVTQTTAVSLSLPSALPSTGRAEPRGVAELRVADDGPAGHYFPHVSVGPSKTLISIGQVGGRARDVVGDGAMAYLSIGPRIVSVDVSDPDEPRQVGQTSQTTSPTWPFTTNCGSSTSLTASGPRPSADRCCCRAGCLTCSLQGTGST
jgi:hypothetical protein